MVRDSNNNIEGFDGLLQNIHLDSFIYNLILPFETCQHLFKDAVFFYSILSRDLGRTSGHHR